MTEVFEHIVQVSPALDRRDPDPTKDHGVLGCNLRFLLKGPKGATQFVVFTNWQLSHVDDERSASTWTGQTLLWTFCPQGADVGYHSLTPQYEDQPRLGPCAVLGADHCYYDGSTMAARHLLKRMIAEGDAAVWSELEAVYREQFGEEET